MNLLENNQEVDKAISMGLIISRTFFNELTTATQNSIKNFFGTQTEFHLKEYYEGKADAFMELSARIEKEYNLAEQYALDLAFQKSNFRLVKDEDIERMLPMNSIQYRGIKYAECMKYRKALSDLLTTYMQEGFRMGIRCANALKEEEIPEIKFNPVELADGCINNFIHPRFIVIKKINK